jgi:DHA1 family tetracycline resistance protein-like MFS transporter
MRLKKRILEARYAELTPLWIAVFIDILGFSVLIPFLPFFSQEYQVPAWQIGLLLSTNALFGFFSGPIWGALSDAKGRKPMLLLSQFGTLIGFLMLAFSGSMTMLYASRIVDGIFGGNYPIAKAIVGDVVPPHDRSREMSNIGVAHVLSSLIGPGLGGLLSRWGILAPGLVSAALTCVTIGLTFFFLKETNPVARRASRQRRALSNPDLGSEPKPADAKEGLARRRTGPASVWSNPIARYLLVQWGFHTLSFMTYMSCISLFAYLRLGLDAGQVGRLLMIAGIVRVFIRFVIFVPLLERLGDRKTSRVGLTTFVVVFFLLGLVRNQLQFTMALCAVSFAASCTRSILNSFLSRSVKPTEQGRAMGLSASLDSFAHIVGPLVGGFILDSLPLWMYGGLAGIFALGAFFMGFRRIEFPHEQGAEASAELQ